MVTATDTEQVDTGQVDTETVYLGVYDTLADWEHGYAVAGINQPEQQRRPGRYRVVTVAEEARPVTTAGGLRLLPDRTLDEIDPADGAMLILPGASAWDEGGLGAMARTAREFLERGVPVAAICGATAGLAREGLLDDRAHTSSVREYLEAVGYAGGRWYRDEPVVADRGLITAGPQSAVDFAHRIFVALDLYERDYLEAWYALFRNQDAAPFTALMAAESS